MSEDDDRIWLDTLAGRAPAGGDTEAMREAARLRSRLLSRTPDEAPAVLEHDPSREEALLARARSEGLIPAPRVRGASFLAGWRPALALAAVIAVGALVGYLARSEREPETVRAGPGGIVRLRSDDPAARAAAIRADLAAAGIAATPYERLGLHGIDADLPQPLPFAVRSVLQRHGIPEPPDGVLRVEIEEATSP